MHAMMKNFSLTKLKRGKSTKSTKSKKSVHWSEELEEIHFYSPEPENFASEDASVTKVEDNFALEKETKINSERTKVNHTTFQPQWKLENMPLSQEHVHSISIEKRQRFALQNVLAVKQESECFGEDWV